jgi:arylsulfatase A-like enzyme
MGISEDECMLSVIRDERYKHVFFPSLPSLLFDMVNDPGERHNLGSDPAFSAVEREYLAKQLTLRILHADRRTSTTVLGRDGMVRYQGYRRS